MLSLQDENMYQMIVHSNVHCNMSYTTSAHVCTVMFKLRVTLRVMPLIHILTHYSISMT